MKAHAFGICVAFLFIGCKGETSAEISVSLAPTIVSDTVWIEIAAFANGSCDTLSDTAFAIPKRAANGYALRKNDGTKTSLGPFESGPLTLVANAKDDSCTILGTACVTVDLSDSDSISLSLAEAIEPVPTCSKGAVCNHGACVAAPVEEKVGGTCSLAIVGQGPLGTPFGIDKTIVSTPAIAKTDAGFLIVYREFDPAIGSARLTTYPLDKSGTALGATRSTLPERCALAPESDPVGLAWSGKKGLVGVARQACGTSPGGLDLFGVNAVGAIQSFVFNPTPDTDVAIQLSPTRSIATNGSNAWVSFLEGDTARIADSTFGGTLSNGATIATGARGSWVAGSSSTAALLVGHRDGTFSLSIGEPGTSPSTWVQARSASGEFGSVAVSGEHVAMLSGSAAGGEIALFDGPASNGTLAIETKGSLTGADVSAADNAAFVFTETKGELSLSVASPISKPTWRETFAFKNEPRIHVPKGLRDGKVAIVASDDRVAVAWVTGNTISYDEPIGGYAVFRCESR